MKVVFKVCCGNNQQQQQQQQSTQSTSSAVHRPSSSSTSIGKCPVKTRFTLILSPSLFLYPFNEQIINSNNNIMNQPTNQDDEFIIFRIDR